MKARLFDTHCLLSYVTDRNQEQLEKVSRPIDEAALHSELYITSNVVSEFVHILEHVYERDTSFIQQLLAALMAQPGIHYLPVHPLDRVLALWPTHIRDYGDAALAAAAEELKTPLFTFDRTFARQLEAVGIQHQLL